MRDSTPANFGLSHILIGDFKGNILWTTLFGLEKQMSNLFEIKED